MKHLWTLGVVLAAIGCGSSSPQEAVARDTATGVLRLTVPQTVVAVPSTDPRWSTEAVVPMVITEISGAGDVLISSVQVAVTDEATGHPAIPAPTVTFENSSLAASSLMSSPLRVRAGRAVECAFRVGLYGAGRYGVRVVVTAWTYNEGRGTGEQAQPGADFTILPPQ